MGLSPKLPRPIFSPPNENGIPTLLALTGSDNNKGNKMEDLGSTLDV